ncbi:hypothetical protein HT102_00065 [Hoyosella sp. G463]|uniref:Uncharacterized protein n=1 Tax=Lolliginicoccus lacisalsi TaxID=2742202 RepID=A0A927J9A2_9ACTN|nr:hypothetical protein [Lolliginicoccus lacisalsi]MBD8504880.1 hypothetical protein [Lolliginicoccus lacisalsi]
MDITALDRAARRGAGIGIPLAALLGAGVVGAAAQVTGDVTFSTSPGTLEVQFVTIDPSDTACVAKLRDGVDSFIVLQQETAVLDAEGNGTVAFTGLDPGVYWADGTCGNDVFELQQLEVPANGGTGSLDLLLELFDGIFGSS